MHREGEFLFYFTTVQDLEDSDSVRQLQFFLISLIRDIVISKQYFLNHRIAFDRRRYNELSQCTRTGR